MFMRHVDPRHSTYSDVHGMTSLYDLNAYLQKQANRQRYGIDDKFGRNFKNDFHFMGIQSSRETQPNVLKTGHRVLVTRIGGRSTMPDLTCAVRSAAHSTLKRRAGGFLNHNASIENTYLWIVPRKTFDKSAMVTETERAALVRGRGSTNDDFLKLTRLVSKLPEPDIMYVRKSDIYMQLVIYHAPTRAAPPAHVTSGRIGNWSWSGDAIKLGWINFALSSRSKDPRWFAQAHALVHGNEGQREVRMETLRALPKMQIHTMIL